MAVDTGRVGTHKVASSPARKVITQEENERLTRVCGDAPMGKVFRSYWIPACLSAEIPERDGSPVRVRLLGEDLICFRDTTGGVGLVAAYCAHRCAPLFFGRNEANGLRCVYHGWKFDRTGQCVDIPTEPPLSRMAEHVRIRAYPTQEAGGIIWTYMGPEREVPPPPDYEWLRVPSSHFHISKTMLGCNYLQAIEGGLDTAHIGFLHNEDLGGGGLLAGCDNQPRLEVEMTEYGFRYVGIRNIRAGEVYVRGYQFIMPCQKLHGSFLRLFDQLRLEGDLNVTMREAVPNVFGHVWVPTDDENCVMYNFAYSADPEIPMPNSYWREFEESQGRGERDVIPGTYRLKRSLQNDYLVDRDRQKAHSFTGIEGIATQDVAVQEGMGTIVDRSQEFPGATDRAVIAVRELLLEATEEIEKGIELRGRAPGETRAIRAGDRVIPVYADWHVAMAEDFHACW